MDNETKREVINLHKKNYSCKEISVKCNLSKYAVSRAITNYNKLGSKYFNIKPGPQTGTMHSLTTAQQKQLETWLLQSDLLTVKDIEKQTATLLGYALKPQTIHNYIKLYFYQNIDYKANYVLFDTSTKRIIQHYDFYSSAYSNWIIDIGKFKNISLIACKYRHTHYYYFFKGSLTASKAEQFIGKFIKRHGPDHYLFVPNTAKNEFNIGNIISYCNNHNIFIYFFTTYGTTAKRDVYIPYDLNTIKAFSTIRTTIKT